MLLSSPKARLITFSKTFSKILSQRLTHDRSYMYVTVLDIDLVVQQQHC